MIDIYGNELGRKHAKKLLPPKFFVITISYRLPQCLLKLEYSLVNQFFQLSACFLTKNYYYLQFVARYERSHIGKVFIIGELITLQLQIATLP